MAQLNFGGFEGHRIINQAIENGLQRNERAQVRAQEAEYKDAYLQIQTQYADQAKQNAVFQNFTMGKQMEQVEQQEYAHDFFNHVAPQLAISDNAVVKDRAFLGVGNDYRVNQQDVTEYLTTDKKSELAKEFYAGAKSKGVKVGVLEFEGMFNMLMSRQVADLSKSMMQQRMDDPNFNQSEYNAMMNQSKAGGVLKQAMIMNANPDPMQSGYSPVSGAESMSWADVAGYAGKGLAVAGSIGPLYSFQKGVIGQALAKDGSTIGNLFKGYAKLNTAEKAGRIAKIMSTESGRKAIENRIAKKLGPTIAKKTVAKIGAKFLATSASASTGVGIPVSLAMGAWTAYDIYQISSMLFGSE